MTLRVLGLLGLGALWISGCGRSIELVDGDGGGGGADAVGSGPTGSGAGGAGNVTGSGPASSGNGGPGSSGNGGPGSSGSGGPGSSGSGGPGSSGSGGPGSSGSGASGSSGSGTVVCSAFDECTDCISSSCPEVWCSCLNNSDCFALYDCVGNCGNDPDCATACYATHADGLSAAVLVADCAASPCDGVCDWGSEPLDPCTKCLYTSCDDEMNACAAEPECTILWECLGTCGPVQLSCHQACYNAHPSGVVPLGDVLGCSADACSSTCN